DLEAELVFVGYGQPVDLVGRDLEGKVAVVRAAMQSDGFFQTARGYMDGVVEAGAVGVLVIMDAPGNHQYALEDMGPGHVPALILGGDDGRFLMAAMAAAGIVNPLKIRIGLTTEIRDSWLGKNVFGLVPGTGDEYVVIVSHLDGYFESANDNGGGLASMLALANYYANEAPEQPKRNMLFVGTSGHHEFSDGVATLIREHKETLDNSVLVMNIEHPSSTLSYYRGPLKFKRATVPGQIATTTTHGTRSLNVSNGNALLIDFYRQAIDRYGLVINAEREKSPPTGDAFDLYRAGYVVVQILDANIWYHSTADRIDVIQEAGMERATRLYADVLDQIDRHSREALQERGKPQ
ncbi:MAG: M28 family peptidase, partial [Gammaproteobacteria bacterium]|nr:M28 family peptidase [Gammaproteobacteria bacterium]